MKKDKIFYGWRVVIGTFLAMGASAGTSIYAFSIFISPVTNELHISASAFMLNMTILMLMSMLLAPVTGKLIEKKGARFATVLGGCIMTAGHLILGFSKVLPMFYIGYGLIGIASGIAGPIIATSVPAKWFHKKKNIATGIITAGNGLFALLLAPLMAKCILSFGYSVSYFVLAAVDVIFIVLCGGLLIRNTPEEMGLVPFGAEDVFETKTDTAKTAVYNPTLSQASRTGTFWCIGIGFALLSIVQFGITQTYNPALQSLKFTPMIAAAVVSIVNIVAAIIKLVYGYLLDHYNTRVITGLGLALTIISSFMIFSFKETTPVAFLYLFAVIFGAASGMWLPVISKHLTDSFGTEHYASIFSIVFMMKNIADTVGPLFPSFVFDTTGSYQKAYFFLGILAVFVAALLLFYKKPKQKI